MLEISGLEYIYTARPPNAKGVSYGGAAIVVNVEKISIEKFVVHIPKSLEVIWGLLNPKKYICEIQKNSCLFLLLPT